MIFGQIDNFYILVEFEVDKMCPNESTKNERKGAQGLYWKIFVIFEAIFEIFDKNNEILCLSDNLKIFVVKPVFG